MFDDFNAFEDHVRSPRGLNAFPEDCVLGAAGGSACGDMLTVGLSLKDGCIDGIGFTAEGCAALTACGSALVELVKGQ